MTKDVKLLPRTGLAGALLCVCAGCLLPQEESVFPALPDPMNRPLQIVSAKPAQGNRTTYLVPTGGNGVACSDPFEIAVSDPDTRDRISYQWYVDRSQTAGLVASGLVYGTGSERRLLTAPAQVARQLSTIADGKEHLVEVIVTDSDFSDSLGIGSVSREPRIGGLLDGGDLVDNAYADSTFWLITVQPCQ